MSVASPRRHNGFLPIRDYAAIGDGRTAALVGRDGAIDWLCLPDFDSPAVFAAILDPDRGGSFSIRPTEAFEATREYLAGSNVLRTTFHTASGTVRVTDAMTLADESRLSPLREVARRIECLSGRVALTWTASPRFDYGRKAARLEQRGEHIVAADGRAALAFGAWNTGETVIRNATLASEFALSAGDRALISLVGAYAEPLVLVGRDDTEERLDATAAFWPRWSARAEYEGPWRDAVIRSALALKLLVFAPSGAIVAAATTSLPESLGTGRNWDYRFTWVRDAAYTLDALLSLGYDDEAHAFFWWLMHASRLTRPRLEVLYGIYGGGTTEEIELDRLRGYRGSRPVRVGNAAADQTQLDVYGAAMEAIWLHAQAHGELEAETGAEIAGIADYVAKAWRLADSGIWEVRSAPVHFVQSKAMCWAALDRAIKLAEAGLVPDRRVRWQAEADAIRAFIDEHGWDEARTSYRRAPELDDVDGSLLTLFLIGYDDPSSERMQGTLEAVRRDLGAGALIDRYRGEDGLEGSQGVFITCSFWMVDALARSGRIAEAETLMDELVGLANDVGLYAEEVDPATNDFLGNFPQALVHLGLINAATSLARA